MPIPFVIDNQQHRMADALTELLGESAAMMSASTDGDLGGER